MNLKKESEEEEMKCKSGKWGNNGNIKLDASVRKLFFYFFTAVIIIMIPYTLKPKAHLLPILIISFLNVVFMHSNSGSARTFRRGKNGRDSNIMG